MSEELKSCPFCGSDDLYIPHPEHVFAWILCNACDTEGPVKNTKEEAITAWNTRAGEKV